MFEVDPDTGIVTVQTVLDREAMSRYRIRVRAVDGGSPTSLTGTALLIVNVVDIDDERPQFLSATYSFQVAENQPRGTEVGRLLAVDADSPSHGRYYFRLRQMNGGHDVETFEINQRSGTIVTSTALDREHRASHVLVAEVFEVASDESDDESVRHHSALAAVRALNSTAVVTIQVLDVNDNSPVFVLPEPEIASKTGSTSEVVMTVSNVARRGSVVATLAAVDVDDGDSGLVTYSISAGNDRNLFRVDAETGDVIADVDFTGDIDNQVNKLRTVPYGHSGISSGLPMCVDYDDYSH